MSTVGQIERMTQNRVVRLFQERLGYEYGGNLEDRDNRNIDESLLIENLLARGYDEALIKRALAQLLTAASLADGQKLYDSNRKFYELLRYGVKVKRDVGETTETVWPIDWATRRPTISWSPRRSRSEASTPSGPTSCSTSTASLWASLS